MTTPMVARRAPSEPSGPSGAARPPAAGGRHDRSKGTFDDEETADLPWRAPLTREEARDLLSRHRAVSPWVVLAVQVAVGGVVALLAALATGHAVYGWSALYGAAVVVVPGALMARGMTSRLSRLAPALSVVSVVAWELVKIAVSLVMLLLAGRLVQPLSWPVMLAAMVLCLQVYWVALRWRGR